ncbi:hypothetical protein [Streptomyces muensis]
MGFGMAAMAVPATGTSRTPDSST